jgi:hypothetical protein
VVSTINRNTGNHQPASTNQASTGTAQVLDPVGCQQYVSNRTVRVDARQYDKVLDLPADLGRRGVGGGAMRSCLAV